MISNQLSLILLPTNKCNVACEYCFEDKTADFMTHEQLSLTVEKMLDHMEQQRIQELIIYWQGGEVMIMQPEWFERAHELISAAAMRSGKKIGHSLQTNMIGYSAKWHRVIGEMFGNSVGTSMDGGCPVRAYVESIAAELSRARFARSLPVLPIRADVVNRGNSL